MKNVFYVSLSRYIQDWVITKYRVGVKYGPIELPLAHAAGRLVYRCLQSNPDFVRWTSKCCCQMVMQTNPERVPKEMADVIPNGTENYVAFVVPERHYYNGRFVPSDNTMQLDSSCTTEFISIFKEEFWEDFEDYASAYYKERCLYNQKRQLSSKRVDEWDMVLDFCDFWEIDPEQVDTLYRQMHRKMKDGTLTIVTKRKP